LNYIQMVFPVHVYCRTCTHVQCTVKHAHMYNVL
jgi:hypothetical protein